MVGEKFSLNNHVKEVSIKILHKIYPTMKKKNWQDVILILICCVTFGELFNQCAFSKAFWTDVCVLYQDSDRTSYSFKKSTFLFILEENLDDDKVFHHIHKGKKGGRF